MFLLFVLFVGMITVQAQEFNGVKIEGSMTNFVTQLKNKGYRLVEKGTDYSVLEGKVGVRMLEVVVFMTPKTNQVYKVTTFLPKKTSWYDLETEYFDYLKILKQKYGDPTESFEFFKDPYYEGDGYEMSAVALEKVFYCAYWMNNKVPNTNLGIAISKHKQIKISYENKKLVAVADREIASIELDAF